MQLKPPPDAWIDLRRLRATPPATVMRKMHPEFRAALDQAESYHRAALSAGPESSPVMLYYGLLQVGRAIVLAGRQPPSVDHGIKVADQSKPTALLDRNVIDSRGGEKITRSHLASLQQVIGEGAGDKLSTTIGELIDGNPDLRMLFRQRPDGRPIAVQPRDPFAHLSYEKRLPTAGLEANVMTARPWPDEQAYGARLTTYPVSPGVSVSSFAVLTLDSVDAGWYEHGFSALWHNNVEGRPNVDEYTLRRWAPAGLYTQAKQDQYVISPLGPTGEAWSRLTWWWPLLYALGHIARYEPLVWSRAIDVDASPEATDLREALRLAGALIPSMGTWAMQRAIQSAT